MRYEEDFQLVQKKSQLQSEVKTPVVQSQFMSVFANKLEITF